MERASWTTLLTVNFAVAGFLLDSREVLLRLMSHLTAEIGQQTAF